MNVSTEVRLSISLGKDKQFVMGIGIEASRTSSTSYHVWALVFSASRGLPLLLSMYGLWFFIFVLINCH
jgi:hypothetical protein